MWKRIVVAAVVAVAALAAFIATRPSVRSAERSVLVEARPEVVQAQIADPRRWVAWSPWERPGTRRTYGGPPEGAGASYYWSGDGQGRLTIVQASAERVEVEREVEKPSPSLSDFEFGLAPEGSGTRVRWRTTRESNGFADKAKGLLRRDQAVGSDLEKGLARLKAVAEARAKGESWRVERSESMAAPPAAVLAQIVDLRRWARWSPWERSSTRRTYGGPAEGAGASYYWSGDEVAGRGRLTIVSATPEKVAVEMELAEPLQFLGDIEFRLVPEGAGTRVTWAMTAEVEARGEALGRAGSPETTLGVDFEKGLARLKAVVEAKAVAR